MATKRRGSKSTTTRKRRGKQGRAKEDQDDGENFNIDVAEPENPPSARDSLHGLTWLHDPCHSRHIHDSLTNYLIYCLFELVSHFSFYIPARSQEMADIINGRCHNERAPETGPPLFQNGKIIIQGASTRPICSSWSITCPR